MSVDRLIIEGEVLTDVPCDIYSESMEPAFARGDILFLTNWASDAYEIGDIPVYKM
jgi:signal peptidase I